MEGEGKGLTLNRKICIETQSRKSSSKRYKGVVPQPNNRWGAQIYQKNQRIWLGTFGAEEEAAKAFDVAAKRLRGPDAVTNFKTPSNVDEVVAEAMFLDSRPQTELMDMIRKPNYEIELELSKQYLISCNNIHAKRITSTSSMNESGNDTYARQQREQLFFKVVTESDVGKLRRLVIPKINAQKHFPLPHGKNGGGWSSFLNFKDNQGILWTFKYSYWRASQSYVITRGWSRFVHEKNLKVGDTVSFERSFGPEKRLFIDCKYGNVSNSMELKLNPQKQTHATKVLRLFGVDILTML